MRQLKNKLAIISILIFILSLFFTAFTVEDMGKIKSYASFEVFIIGSISFLGGAGKEFLTWTANVWFLISLFCVFRKYNSMAMVSGFISILISGSFIFCTEILAAENGRMAKISSLNTGYFLWLFSMLFITFSAAYLKLINKKNAPAG